jgi:hypothetical protein
VPPVLRYARGCEFAGTLEWRGISCQSIILV